jgi:hypothetical protein
LVIREEARRLFACSERRLVLLLYMTAIFCFLWSKYKKCSSAPRMIQEKSTSPKRPQAQREAQASAGQDVIAKRKESFQK